MMKKSRMIKDLKKDDMINDIFVVKFKKPVEPYKNGYKFELRLGDSSKEIMYKYWGPPEENKVKLLYDLIKHGDVVHLQGRVSEWNSNLEISANDQHTVRILQPGEYDIKDFIRESKRRREEMWKELVSYADMVKNKDIKKILDHFFMDKGFADKFSICPAAMYIHHGWIGGLLEHTISVAKLCIEMQKIHASLDLDYLLAGALLHDIGKLNEFEITTSIRVTTEGMLVGHVNIGIEMLNKAMDSADTPKEIRIKLVHMLMTHMGEYGSAKTPAFPEAMAVYHADHADAMITHMILVKEEAATEDDYIYTKDMGNVYLK